ncbi:MAG: hypothetical protein HQL44_12195 [Alphaproteobacteria bacterium]|nr:hypothetical protein [Alphaproteobacteria bacterium]
MNQWLIDLLAKHPDDGNWAKRRRMMYLDRWSSYAVAAAMYDRDVKGDATAFNAYVADIEAIKAAVPKEVG